MNEPSLEIVDTLCSDGTKLVLAMFEPCERTKHILSYTSGDCNIRVSLNHNKDLISLRIKGVPQKSSETNMSYKQCIESLRVLANILTKSTIDRIPINTLCKKGEFTYREYRLPEDSKCNIKKILSNILKVNGPIRVRECNWIGIEEARLDFDKT